MIARLALMMMIGFAAAASNAQDSAPASRGDGSRRFHKILEAPIIEGASIVAQAIAGGSTITVLADGVVYYSEGGRHYEARVPTSTRDRIMLERAAIAQADGLPLSMEELCDLVRLPCWTHGGGRGATFNCFQDPDGSWSPGDWDWYCDEEDLPVATGMGKESFRIGATALMAVDLMNAGFGFGSGVSQVYRVPQAINYLMDHQRPYKGFADATETSSAMTNACAAIALCRAAVLAKRFESDSRPASEVESQPRLAGLSPPLRLSDRARSAIRRVRDDQNPDGSWGKDADEARRLSTAVWNLLALKAGATAGIESDPAIANHGLTWIQFKVAAIEYRSNMDPTVLPRARASRAVARAATGAASADLAADVEWLSHAFERGGAPVQDAETILFGALAGWKCGGTAWEQAGRGVRGLVIDTQVKAGCAEGTWDMPCVWSDLGGRLASTALMTWALEIYYRYPMAMWVD